jgi:septum formation topological specificity factor MinE
MTKESIQIESYQPQYKEAFKTLNLEWIQKYFKVEPHDVEQLENPEKYILESGGQIFLLSIKIK